MDMMALPPGYHSDIENALQFLKSAGCAQVFLFGSMVTGKIHEKSDIDIGIKGLPPHDFFRVSADLDRYARHKIDLVDFDLYKDLYTLLDSFGEVVCLG